jgi:glycosyltransferase involved in cell wall biosynthesis
MPSQVRFVGFVANHDLPQHYRRAQLACLPSLTETFGMPLVEAMACGIPTVASAAGGIPEIVEHGITGALVPVFDVDALAHAITSLMSDPEKRRRMGDAARERAKALFSWEAVASALVEIYRQPPSDPSRARVLSPASPSHKIAALS